MFSTSTAWTASIALLIGAVSIVMAYRAVLTSRTPQGTVGWILLILFLPAFGSFLYLLFGHANYKKFEKERGRSDADLYSELRGVQAEGRLAPFAHIAGLPVTDGNDTRLLIDGEETFEAVFSAIRQATHTVMVQFYTIKDDEVGRALRDCLVERARAGVDIWVIHDELPFFGLPRAFKRSLTEVGVRLERPKGPQRLLGPFQFNYRNHRKLVIVDGGVAFTGGLNISESYLGRDKHIGAWRDTFAEFRGPVVAQLALHFVSDWSWTTGEDLRERLVPDPEPHGTTRAVALAPSPADQLCAGNLYFLALAHAAQHRLWISTPYFAPDSDVISALRFAALRGVDVRVLVPKRADHYVMWFAAMAYFDDLRSAGGQIWTYDSAFLHQKVALVDDDLTSVGSINLDIRSGLLNFEITVVMEGAEAAQQVEDMLKTDFSIARQVDFDLEDRPVLIRVAARISRLFAPIL